MKKIFIPLLTAVMVVSIILAGCVPGAAPAPPITPPPVAPPVTPPVTPPPEEEKVPPAFQALKDQGLIEPHLELNPFGRDFAVKPDGTPYYFAYSNPLMTCEELVNWEGVNRSYIVRAGGTYTQFAAEAWNIEQQVAYLEDIIDMVKPDAISIMSADEYALIPVVDKAAAAGIPFFTYGIDVISENRTSFSHHYWEGDIGSNVMGEWFVKKAHEENRHITILEVWGVKSLLFIQQRHENFHKGLADDPLITVIESRETLGNEEDTADAVMDALTAHPEINAIFHQCGGQAGVVSALRALGRLELIGHPDHIMICGIEAATLVQEAMDAGYYDATGTHGPWDSDDVSVKTIFYHVVLGQPVPKEVSCPMIVIEAEEMRSKKLFGACYWTVMPRGRWDLWPVLDTSEPGCLRIIDRTTVPPTVIPWELETPNLAMRMELMGY